MPGIGGNSTYSGSGGDITLPAELPIIATWAKNSSPGNPTFTLSKNGAPGPGGKGGQGADLLCPLFTTLTHHQNPAAMRLTCG